MSLSEFLVYASGTGSIIIVSWLLERSMWFQAKTSEAKQAIVYGASCSLAVTAWAIASFVDPMVLKQLEPVFMILSLNFISIFLGQVYHKLARLMPKG